MILKISDYIYFYVCPKCGSDMAIRYPETIEKSDEVVYCPNDQCQEEMELEGVRILQ